MQTNGSKQEKGGSYLANTKVGRVYLVFYFSFYKSRAAVIISTLRCTRNKHKFDDIISSLRGGSKIRFRKKSKNQSNQKMNSVVRCSKCTLKTFKLLFFSFMTRNNVKAYKASNQFPILSAMSSSANSINQVNDRFHRTLMEVLLLILSSAAACRYPCYPMTTESNRYPEFSVVRVDMCLLNQGRMLHHMNGAFELLR